VKLGSNFEVFACPLAESVLFPFGIAILGICIFEKGESLKMCRIAGVFATLIEAHNFVKIYSSAQEDKCPMIVG